MKITSKGNSLLGNWKFFWVAVAVCIASPFGFRFPTPCKTGREGRCSGSSAAGRRGLWSAPSAPPYLCETATATSCGFIYPAALRAHMSNRYQIRCIWGWMKGCHSHEELVNAVFIWYPCSLCVCGVGAVRLLLTGSGRMWDAGEWWASSSLGAVDCWAFLCFIWVSGPCLQAHKCGTHPSDTQIEQVCKVVLRAEFWP